MLSLRERLRNYKAASTHPTDIREPMVRALFWLDEERAAAQTIEDCRGRPDLGHVADSASYDLLYARAARQRARARFHDSLKSAQLERAIEQHSSFEAA